MEAHRILPSEGTSLYRLVRSVVQRVQVEKETREIVEEISQQHLDALVKQQGPGTAVNRKRLVEEADARLTKLANDIPHRIGEQGTGAQIVSKILLRNVE